MYLLIDMSGKDQIDLSLFTKDELYRHSEQGRNKELLHVIDAFLKQQKISKETIAGIMVVVGAGGFTSTRLAVTVANTFASVLQIPLLALSEQEAREPRQHIDKILAQPPGQLLSATYSGDPNIIIKQAVPSSTDG